MTPSSSAATSTGDSGSSVTVSKPFANPLAPGGSSLLTFQFGAASSSTTAASAQAASTTTATTLAPSPFSFGGVKPAAPAKTTAVAPFAFLANAAGPATTPAGSFSFGSNTASVTASAATGTFQFAPQNTESAGSLKPQPQTSTGASGLFQFGAANAATVTNASTQPPSQTFGVTSTPANPSSEPVKPFSFNTGSTAQGFSFAPVQSSGTTGGMPSSFTFGASAPKPESTFPGFAPAQPSSQQTVSVLPLKASSAIVAFPCLLLFSQILA